MNFLVYVVSLCAFFTLGRFDERSRRQSRPRGTVVSLDEWRRRGR